MNIVNMLLNPHSKEILSGASQPRISSRPGNTTRYASLEFSRVLDNKLSANGGEGRTRFEMDFKKKQLEIQQGNQNQTRSMEDFSQEKQGRSERNADRQKNKDEFFRQVSRQFTGEEEAQKFKNTSEGEQQQKQEFTLKGWDREEIEQIREIVQEEFGTEKEQKSSGENLTKKQKEIIEKIEKGTFNLSNDEDLKELKKLLEQFSEDGKGATNEQGLKLFQRLFSSDRAFEELFGGNLSPEETREQLQNIEDFLKKTEDLLNGLTEAVNSSLVNQLEEGFEKLNAGDGDEINQQDLTKLLKQIKQALGREGSTETEAVKQMKQLIKQVENLAQQLEKQVQNGNELSSTDQKKLKNNLKQLARQLNNAFKKERGTKEGKTKLTRETLNQFQNALKIVEETVDKSDQKQNLAQQIKRFQESRANQSNHSEQSKQSGSEEETHSSSDQAKQAENEQLTEQSSQKIQQSDEVKNQEVRRAEKNSKQNQSEKKASENENKASDSQSEQSKNAKENSRNSKETAQRDVNNQKQNQSSEKTTSVEQQKVQTAAERSAQDQAKTNSSSGEAGGQNSTQTDQQPKPNPNQITTQSVRAAERSQESAKGRGEYSANNHTVVNPEKVSQQSTSSGETGSASTSTENTDSQKFQVVKPDASNQQNQSGKKHSQKMIQYEVNAAQVNQNARGTGGEFQNSGQQQGRSFQGNAASQSFRGSNFSQRMLEARQVIDQMVERTQTMVNEGKQTMKVQLQPAVLGEMKMSVTLEGNQVKAKVQVDKQSVKHLLDENMKDLKMAMNNIGVELDEIDVSESGDGDKGTDFWFDEQQNGHRGSESNQVEETEEVAQARGHTNPTREYSSIELVA